ncbi:MAG: SDR family oxidoreductase [Desulfobacterales bacterium]|nr:MAG: SDR family oxidoreductase [Desulfobacterales bacterium]
MRLKDKNVLVIGGSSGMGLAIAEAAVREGAAVIIAGRSESKLNAACQKIGANVRQQPVDFTDEAAVKRLFTAVGPIDHLAIPGSAVKTGPLKELPLSDAKSSMDSKFFGPYLAVREARINSGGSVVLFSGILSRRPDKGSPILAAVNSAVETLGKALAVELAPIRVNVISPGMTRDTGAYLGMPEKAREEMFANVARSLPVKRVGRPSDIATVAVELMANSFITGAVIDVDGGGLLS